MLSKGRFSQIKRCCDGGWCDGTGWDVGECYGDGDSVMGRGGM